MFASKDVECSLPLALPDDIIDWFRRAPDLSHPPDDDLDVTVSLWMPVDVEGRRRVEWALALKGPSTDVVWLDEEFRLDVIGRDSVDANAREEKYRHRPPRRCEACSLQTLPLSFW